MNEDMASKTEMNNQKLFLGIEFGSTRIKALLIDENNGLVASGSHDWENQLENGIWTYDLERVWAGLQDCYRKLKTSYAINHPGPLRVVDGIGFSAMMHGYMPFDAEGNLLVPFRTWRNTLPRLLLHNSARSSSSTFRSVGVWLTSTGDPERGRTR